MYYNKNRLIIVFIFNLYNNVDFGPQASLLCIAQRGSDIYRQPADIDLSNYRY